MSWSHDCLCKHDRADIRRLPGLNAKGKTIPTHHQPFHDTDAALACKKVTD